MKYSTLIDNMDKVITLYCAANGDFEAIKTEIKEIRHPAAEAELPTYNTTIIDIEWHGNDNSDSTTLVLDERDGTVHILKDMQSGCVDKDADLSDYDWEDLTAFVSEDDVVNYDKVIKNQIIKKALEVIDCVKSHKMAMRVEASTCGHLVEEWLREFEENGYNDIVNATEKDVVEAYDECVDFGCENIDAFQVLRQIASHASCNDEHASIDRVNVWDVVRH